MFKNSSLNSLNEFHLINTLIYNSKVMNESPTEAQNVQIFLLVKLSTFFREFPFL